MSREKISLRLEPEIIVLGRKLAKKDFGSEQKFGLLIENAIRSYHARQVQPVEASSLLSATEEALINRIEKRIEEMGKQTVNRVGNLIAKSSYDTAYSTLITEQIYTKQNKNAKANLDQMRSAASQRMRQRFDKESAEEISNLLAENKNLVDDYNAVAQQYRELKEQANKVVKVNEQLKNNVTELKQENHNKDAEIAQLEDANDNLGNWTRGLIKYLETNSAGLMKKPANKLVEEYMQQKPKPEGLL